MSENSEEAINTESGQQDASTILSENGDLTKEGGHANNGQENDLCHQCWLRELHLAAAEKQQADQLIREKSGEAAILNHCNQHEGAWDYQDTDKKALESRKQREKEIKEYNFKMAREKQENEKTDHKTFLEESPRKIQEVESANTGYLMYKRPDTASYAKSNKTKQQLHREELERQVKLKQDLENKDRNEDLQNSSRLNYNSQQEVNAEKSKLKQRNQRNKIEYRKALETQIAAKNVGSNFETGEREIGWSDRESENREKVDFQTDQSKRHARQEKAAKDLEAFKMRQKETDVAERERRMQVSAFMREEQQNFPEEEAKTVSQKESKLERQRQVESAWQKAEEETNQKFDILRNQHGGSLLDQLKQYRRCRKCQKAIVDKQQPGNGKKEESWEEMNRDLLRPLDQDDLHIDHGHKHKHENNNKQLKSRHL